MLRVPLLVFAGTPWEPIVRRPHHILTRLAGSRDIMFVEQPLVRPGPPEVRLRPVAPGIQVLRVSIADPGPSFGLEQTRTLVGVLRDLLDAEGWTDFAVWLGNPMAVHVARELGARAIVYDCVDDVTTRFAETAELMIAERELMRVADVVLTGGPGLHESKRALHPFTRCFPDCVDVQHFANGIHAPEPAEYETARRPRFGFFGTIDERLDLDRITDLADARPDASITMIGPHEIHRAAKPHRHNLRWLGARPYAELPAHVRAWDVCLLPFVMERSTRLLNPSQTLQYLAADRPVVSTAVPDVVRQFGGIVHIAERPEEFVAACVRALESPEADRHSRRERAGELLKKASWNETARRIGDILHYVADTGKERSLSVAHAAHA